jgi:hypothetical protein
MHMTAGEKEVTGVRLMDTVSTLLADVNTLSPSDGASLPLPRYKISTCTASGKRPNLSVPGRSKTRARSACHSCRPHQQRLTPVTGEIVRVVTLRSHAPHSVPGVAGFLRPHWPAATATSATRTPLLPHVPRNRLPHPAPNTPGRHVSPPSVPATGNNKRPCPVQKPPNRRLHTKSHAGRTLAKASRAPPPSSGAPA